ncbi:MAG: Flp pilus assembly protein CpaB [Acidobacteriia bacterium]|nr:Flp pilus assembly protein CpaB [Terriglobia bacterium]
MDKKRVILALSAAVLLSAVATVLLYLGMSRRQGPEGKYQKVVAATRSINPGSILTAENLVLLDWPSNLIIPGSFSRIEDVKDRSLIYPVSERQPILAGFIAAPGSGIGLTVKIPQGMRATSVRSNEVSGVAGFLYPGSHVDVLVSYRPPNGPGQQTQTVLQNVEVLTAGQQIEPDPHGKPATVNVVTLLLTPQDAQKVVLANQEGSIQFVLRNGADTTQVATAPVEMPQLIRGMKPEVPVEGPPVKAARAVKGRQIAKALPEKFHEVETIEGDKHSTDRFKAPD